MCGLVRDALRWSVIVVLANYFVDGQLQEAKRTVYIFHRS